MELISRQAAIDVVAKQYRYESDRMTALQEVPIYNFGWIPVSERMPEDGAEVLVTDRYGELRIAYHSREGWHLALTGSIYVREPKVWMPLPEPYRPEPGKE